MFLHEMAIDMNNYKNSFEFFSKRISMWSCTQPDKMLVFRQHHKTLDVCYVDEKEGWIFIMHVLLTVYVRLDVC